MNKHKKWKALAKALAQENEELRTEATAWRQGRDEWRSRAERAEARLRDLPELVWMVVESRAPHTSNPDDYCENASHILSLVQAAAVLDSDPPEQAPDLANPERVNNGCSIYRSPDESAS